MSSAPPLPEAAGYAVVLGLGLAFALFMNGVTWIQKTFSQYSPSSASEFSAASRSLKTGLVVAGIVSSCKIFFFFCCPDIDLVCDRDMEFNPSPKCDAILCDGRFWRLLVCDHTSFDTQLPLTFIRYAVGGTMQIAIFSVIASKVKINANRATTFPEVTLRLLFEESN